jgi:hypothetical protein
MAQGFVQILTAPAGIVIAMVCVQALRRSMTSSLLDIYRCDRGIEIAPISKGKIREDYAAQRVRN